jgi:hypothetical protein
VSRLLQGCAMYETDQASLCHAVVDVSVKWKR